jgi:hypothetical protein
VSRVLGAPHDPDRGTSESAGKGKHLNTGIVLEGGGRDNSVLDGVGGTCTDSDSTDHLEDGSENHGLSVGDGAGRDRSSPRVGDIVLVELVSSMKVKYPSALLTSTVVVGVEQGKESADSKDVVVLSELGHGYCWCCWPQVAMSTKEWWSAWSWDAEESRGLSGQYIYTASSRRLGTVVCGVERATLADAKGSRPGWTRAKRSSKGESAVGRRRLLSATFRLQALSRRAGRTCQKGAL